MIRHPLPVACAALVALIAWPVSCAAQAEWWKDKPQTRVDQRIADPGGQTAARLKWDDGYIEVQAGATADAAVALNRAHARGLAADAARQLAYFKLAEIIEGVAIDGVTVVKNAVVEDQTVRSTVRALVRGARVVSEKVTENADGVWAEVVMGLLLRGPGSLSESVAGYATSRPQNAYPADQRFAVNEAYTGVVVDVSDVPFTMALAPRLVEEATGKEIFAANLIDPASFARLGAVGYAVSIGDARAHPRVGSNPLIVRAIGTAGAKNADLVLSKRDSERVAAADRAGGFLRNAAVIVARGTDRASMVAHPGTRHAFIVGVDDYGQAGTGVPPTLNYAARDARTIAGLLARGGTPRDAVTLLENASATKARVLDGLKTLRTKVRDEDTVVIFFSGHGSIGPGPDGRLHYYLVPHDGRIDKLAATGLQDDALEEAIGQLPARQIVVILDACYSGGAVGVIRPRGVTNTAAGAAPSPRPFIEASAGRVVLSASRPDQTALEDDQRGGIFTSFLLEGLGGAADTNNDGFIDVLELYQFLAPRVRDYVRQQHGQEQAPVLEVRNLSDQMVLVRRR